VEAVPTDAALPAAAPTPTQPTAAAALEPPPPVAAAAVAPPPISAAEPAPPPAKAVEVFIGDLVGGYRVLSAPIRDCRYTRFDTYSVELKRTAVLLIFEHNRLPAAAPALATFATAAQSLSLDQHPGVARVLDAGELSGHPFLVYEPAGVLHLDQLLSCMGTLRIQRLAHLGLLASEALGAAAAAGQLHGGLQPDCIGYCPDGTISILGLGARGLVEATCPAPQARLDAQLYAVSVPFAAPEQAELGWRSTAQADMYSLGAILYLIASGHSPQPRALAQLAASDPAPNIVDRLGGYGVPSPLAEVIARYMAPASTDRYRSWEAAKQAIEVALAQCSALTHERLPAIPPAALDPPSDSAPAVEPTESAAPAASAESAPPAASAESAPSAEPAPSGELSAFTEVAAPGALASDDLEPTLAPLLAESSFFTFRVAQPLLPLEEERYQADCPPLLNPRAAEVINQAVQFYDSAAESSWYILTTLVVLGFLSFLIFLRH
jgi:serine/threonine protein kinase